MNGPIVVGVSSSTGSPFALRWAAEEAALRGTKVRAVLTWRPPRAPVATGGRPPATLTVVSDYAAEAQESLRGFVSKALGSEDGVECRAVRGNAVTALLAETHDAQLLVLGEPEPGRIAAVKASLLAPVLVAQSPCPVVAIPAAVADGHR